MKFALPSIVFAVFMSISMWQAGEAVYIHAKAWLAQKLIASAWKQTTTGVSKVEKPWRWADTYPVARLVAPRQNVDLLVLAGSSGRTLAFGPGHISGTPTPGNSGNAVVSGHRDTHFSFLQHLRIDENLFVEGANGAITRYVVTGYEVVHRKDVRVLRNVGDTRLTLVTCYPFDSISPGGPLRYVVVAQRADEELVAL